MDKRRWSWTAKWTWTTFVILLFLVLLPPLGLHALPQNLLTILPTPLPAILGEQTVHPSPSPSASPKPSEKRITIGIVGDVRAQDLLIRVQNKVSGVEFLDYTGATSSAQMIEWITRDHVIQGKRTPSLLSRQPAAIILGPLDEVYSMRTLGSRLEADGFVRASKSIEFDQQSLDVYVQYTHMSSAESTIRDHVNTLLTLLEEQ